MLLLTDFLLSLPSHLFRPNEGDFFWCYVMWFWPKSYSSMLTSLFFLFTWVSGLALACRFWNPSFRAFVCCFSMKFGTFIEVSCDCLTWFLISYILISWFPWENILVIECLLGVRLYLSPALIFSGSMSFWMICLCYLWQLEPDLVFFSLFGSPTPVFFNMSDPVFCCLISRVTLLATVYSCFLLSSVFSPFFFDFAERRLVLN